MKYSDLIVWGKAINLVEKIYEYTKKFPNEEKFSLIDQIRRAAISIPSNIAEGHGRKATKAYLNHLSIAFGSLMEVETQIIIANRLQYIQKEQLKEILNITNEISKMLNSLIYSIKKQLP